MLDNLIKINTLLSGTIISTANKEKCKHKDNGNIVKLTANHIALVIFKLLVNALQGDVHDINMIYIGSCQAQDSP